MAGKPNGRVSLSFLGIYTRLAGNGLYFLALFCQCQVPHLRGWPLLPQLYTIDCRPLRVSPQFDGLRRALPRLRLYYEPVRLPYLYDLSLASSACWGMQAIRLSQSLP